MTLAITPRTVQTEKRKKETKEDPTIQKETKEDPTIKKDSRKETKEALTTINNQRSFASLKYKKQTIEMNFRNEIILYILNINMVVNIIVN